MTASSKDEKYVRRSIVGSLGIDEETASRLSTAFLLASIGGVGTPVLPATHARRSSHYPAAPVSPLKAHDPAKDNRIPTPVPKSEELDNSATFTVGLVPRARRRSSVRLLAGGAPPSSTLEGGESSVEHSPTDATFEKVSGDGEGVSLSLAPFTPLAVGSGSPGHHPNRGRLPSLFEHTLRLQSSFVSAATHLHANSDSEMFGGNETGRRRSSAAAPVLSVPPPGTTTLGITPHGAGGGVALSTANRKNSATKLDERQRQAATRRARNFAKSLNSLLQRQQAREGYGSLRSTAADVDEGELSMERELRGSSWFSHVYLATHARRLLESCLHQRAVRLLIKALSPLIVRSVFRRRRNAAISRLLENQQQKGPRGGVVSTSDLVRSSMVLAKWPLELVEELRNALVPFAAPQGVCVALAGEPQVSQSVLLITTGVVVEVPNSEDRKKFAHSVWNTNDLRTPDSSSMRSHRDVSAAPPSVPSARSILPFLFEPYRASGRGGGGGGAAGAKTPTIVIGSEPSRGSNSMVSTATTVVGPGATVIPLASSPPGASASRVASMTSSSSSPHHSPSGTVTTAALPRRGSTSTMSASSAAPPPAAAATTALSSSGTAMGDPASAAEAMQLFSELQQWSAYAVIGDVSATLGFTCRRSIRCWTNVQGYAIPREAFVALFDRLQPSARADAIQAAKSAAKSCMATRSKPTVQEIRNMHPILAAWPTALLVHLQGILMPSVAVEGEVIARDVLRSSKLYIMVSGLAVIDVVSSCDRSIPTRTAVTSLGPKALTGLSGLVLCDCPTVAGEEWTLRAKSFCELWTASIADLELALQQYKIIQSTVSIATDAVRAVADRQLHEFLALIGSSPSNVSLLQSKVIQANMFGCLMGILKLHPALQSIPERAIARLARMLRLRVTFPGERLTLEKTTVKEFVVIFSGSATLTRSSDRSTRAAAATASDLVSKASLGGGTASTAVMERGAGGTAGAAISSKEVFPRTILGLAELCTELPCDYTAITERSALVFSADRHEVLDAVSNAGKDFSAMYAVLERCEVLTGKKSAKAAEEERAKRSREIEALEREAREKELQAGRERAADRARAFHAREVSERHAREAAEAASRHIPHNAIIAEREAYLKRVRLSFQRLTVENRVFASMGNQLYQYVQNEEALRRHHYYSNPHVLLQPVVKSSDSGASSCSTTAAASQRGNLVAVLLPDGTVDLISQELADELWSEEEEQQRREELTRSQCACPTGVGKTSRRQRQTTSLVRAPPPPPPPAAASVVGQVGHTRLSDASPDGGGNDPQLHHLDGAPPPLRMSLSAGYGHHNQQSPRFEAMDSVCAVSGHPSSGRAKTDDKMRSLRCEGATSEELFAAVLLAPLREQDVPEPLRAAPIHGALDSKTREKRGGGNAGGGGGGNDKLVRLISDVIGDDLAFLLPHQQQQQQEKPVSSTVVRKGVQHPHQLLPISDDSAVVREGPLGPPPAVAAATATSPRSAFSPQLSDLCVASTDIPYGAMTPPRSSMMASPAGADYASTAQRGEEFGDERAMDAGADDSRQVRLRKPDDAAFLREARRPRPLHTHFEGILPVPPPIVQCSASVQHRVEKMRETVSLLEIGDYDGLRTKHFIREALVEPPLLPQQPSSKKSNAVAAERDGGGGAGSMQPPTFGTQLRYVVNPFPHVPHRPSILVSESGQPRIGRTLPRSLLQASSSRAAMHHQQQHPHHGATVAASLLPVLQIKSVERLVNAVVSVLPEPSDAAIGGEESLAQKQ